MRTNNSGMNSNHGVQDSRQSPQNNGIGILNNSPLSLLLASLRSRDLNVEDCIGFKPRDRRVQTSASKKTTATPTAAPATPATR